jgi:DNA polymerase III alpha subunit
MLDPITAIATATAAYNTVCKMVAMGRDVEDTLGQIGKWYGAVSDFSEAKKQAENPPLFKKIFNTKSVEQEALEIYIQEKKIKQQEKELRELLMYTYGPNGYKDLIDLRRRIREEREKTVYAQARRRQKAFWTTVQSATILIMCGMLYEIQAYIFEAVQQTTMS